MDFVLDMNKVIMELTANSIIIWPDNNKVLSSILLVKYFILNKIALSNWLPSFHKSYVTKDMATLLFFIGIGEKFDIGKLLFVVIMHNAEHEHTYGILPLPSLIFEVLMLQKNILGMRRYWNLFQLHYECLRSYSKANMLKIFRNLQLFQEIF